MYCFSCLIVASISIIFLVNRLLYNLEQKTFEEAPKITWTQDDMENMAKKKKDEEMTDEEYNIKYGAFRHEVYRTGKIGKPVFTALSKILYWIELNIIHGGEKKLREKTSIYKPIFIIGDFRSGTSVLERLIVHHKDITAFNITENFVWTAPKLWDYFTSFLQHLREKYGHKSWNAPDQKGIFWPHSSNNLLNRMSSFELEIMWQSCKQNMTNNRDFNWETLEDEVKNRDNSSDEDVLTYNYSDPEFEAKLQNAIRMLLLHRKCTRFINKNPLNGFRIGFIKKMFPDVKFIFITRDPVRTTESQILMQDSTLRSFYANEKEFRINNMKPPVPTQKEIKEKYHNKHWAFLTHGHYPNEHSGELMIPRVFPRSYPEHFEISKYLKQDKRACAFAMAVRQHERVAIQQFNDPKNSIKEGENLLTIYHEDILDDAYFAFEKILEFCELKSTNEERSSWLNAENFRHSNSLTPTTSTSGIESIINAQNKQIKQHKLFKEETEQVLKILEPCLQRFNQRGTLKQRIQGKGIWKNM